MTGRDPAEVVVAVVGAGLEWGADVVEAREKASACDAVAEGVCVVSREGWQRRPGCLRWGGRDQSARRGNQRFPQNIGLVSGMVAALSCELATLPRSRMLMSRHAGSVVLVRQSVPLKRSRWGTRP